MTQETVQQLYEQYRCGIYRFALSILKSPAQAEDVLQETFVRLLQSGGTPYDPGMERPWLYRVARNLCYDALRHKKREVPESSVPPEPAANLTYLDLIAPLSKREQEIVSLKLLGNLSHAEIASVLHLTTHAAKKRYERAIGKLRAQMKEE